MVLGIHGLTNAINGLSSTVQSFLNSALATNINNFVALVNANIADPNLKQQVLNLLGTLQNTLEQAQNANILGVVADTLNQLNQLLSGIDNQQVHQLFNNITDALQIFNTNSNNIKSALEGISCLKDLVEVAKNIAAPANFFLYGAGGGIIGGTILKAIQILADRQQDKNLKKLIDLAATNLIVNIGILRQTAAQTILAHVQVQHQGINLANPENFHVNVAIREAYNIIRDIAPINTDTLQRIQKSLDVLLEHLYLGNNNDKSLCAVLDKVTLNYINNANNLNYLFFYVVCEFSWRSQVTAPDFDRNLLSYDLLARLYGREAINALMLKVAAAFGRQGGDALFRETARSMANSERLFSQRLSFVIDAVNAANHQNVRALRDAYTNMHVFVTQQPEFNNLHLSENEIRLIIDRGLLQLAADSAKYFYAPYNLFRESFYGVADVATSLWNFIRHPIQAPIDMFRGFYQLTTNPQARTALLEICKSHPTRILVSTAVGSLVTKAIVSNVPVPSQITGTIASETTSMSRTMGVATESAVRHGRVAKQALDLTSTMSQSLPTTAVSTPLATAGVNVVPIAGVASVTVTNTQSDQELMAYPDNIEEIEEAQDQEKLYTCNFSNLVERLRTQEISCMEDVYSVYEQNILEEPATISLSPVNENEEDVVGNSSLLPALDGSTVSNFSSSSSSLPVLGGVFERTVGTVSSNGHLEIAHHQNTLWKENAHKEDKKRKRDEEDKSEGVSTLPTKKR